MSVQQIVTYEHKQKGEKIIDFKQSCVSCAGQNVAALASINRDDLHVGRADRQAADLLDDDVVRRAGFGQAGFGQVSFVDIIVVIVVPAAVVVVPIRQDDGVGV